MMHFINNFLTSFDWMGVGGIEVVVLILLAGFGLVAVYYIFKRVLGSAESIKELPLFKNGYVKTE
jgi:hypothetical protein